VLRIESLNSHYGLSHVLQGVDLEVRAGEVVCLFGRNGVGKTTVMKTIVGWVAPSGGRITLDGEDLAGKPSDAICRLGVGFVPEDRRIFPGFTVEENLKLGFLQCPRRSSAEGKRALERAYERFPRLKQRRRQIGVTLSGGEQQMLAMARVLVGAPKVLLIDEPTEGLAPMVVDEIFAIIDGLRKDGIPILLVEQKVFRALDVCNRFYALDRGQVVASGDAGSLADRDALLRAIAV
jgi:branched-chain amino acid transport system ATP-binding protein